MKQYFVNLPGWCAMIQALVSAIEMVGHACMADGA
jgi:hypothetical protein